jgi:hypothetical protein
MFKKLVEKAKKLVSKKESSQDTKPVEIVAKTTIQEPIRPYQWVKRPTLKHWGTPMAWKDTDKFKGGRAHTRKLNRQKRKNEVLAGSKP